MKVAILIGLLLLVGCETTANKRQNGTNTSHINNKMKNVTIYGSLHVGGDKQNTEGASQEGLGKVKAEAKVEDSLNGQDELLKEVVPTPE